MSHFGEQGVRLGVEVRRVNQWVQLDNEPKKIDEPDPTEASDDPRAVLIVKGSIGMQEQIDWRIDQGLPALSEWEEDSAKRGNAVVPAEEEFYRNSGGFCIADEEEGSDRVDILMGLILWGDGLQELAVGKPGLAARLTRRRKIPAGNKPESTFPRKVRRLRHVREGRLSGIRCRCETIFATGA